MSVFNIRYNQCCRTFCYKAALKLSSETAFNMAALHCNFRVFTFILYPSYDGALWPLEDFSPTDSPTDVILGAGAL